MLREYQEIDKNGFVVESHVRDDEHIIPVNYKLSWSTEESFYVPMWDFKKGMWIEGQNPNALLVETKEAKREKLSKYCQKSILDGFKCIIKNKEYRFNYDQEAQRNMSDRWNLFQNDMIDYIKVTAHDEDEIDVRLTFNKSEFNELYLSSVHHKENCISKYRDDLLPLVDQATNVEQVEAITWDTVVVEPVPSLVVVEDDNTLDKQVEEMKISQAEGDMGILSLLSMMGVLG